jgi:ATP-dependent DNA helicase DinG
VSGPEPGAHAAERLDDRSVRDLLAAVTAALPVAEERPGQVEMAVQIARALRNGRHAVVRAGTGTGKTLGYLVPVVASARRTVVSTATKALQDQLARQDLPLVERVLGPLLGRPVRWAVLKGRANYLCAQRVAEVGDDARLDLHDASAAVRTEVKRLVEWAAHTPTGDEADLDWQPSRAAWRAVSVTSDECPGAARCASGEVCFSERARTVAQAAAIVVVNGWLYALDVASDSALLGDHEVVVVDEAHELEDVVTDSVGVGIGPGRIGALGSALRAILVDDELMAALARSANRLRDALAPLAGRRVALPVTGEPRAALDDLRMRTAAAAEALRAARTGDEGVQQRRVRAQSACTRLLADLDVATTGRDGDVAFVSGPAERPLLEIKPLRVGPVLADAVWSRRLGVLTSATIASTLRDRLGLPGERVEEHDVGSPFDYAHHALLYCAAHLPDPAARGTDRDDAVHDELAALIEAAGGRTLALFTSRARLAAAADALADRVAHPILRQDDLPKTALVRAFAHDEASCLFATQGFFQGIDVPGATLSLVVLDRIPFPVPTDPLVAARREAHGDRAFAAIDVPVAATKLAQAAGRLIRTETDRGVVAVLDPRLATKSYAAAVRAALPPMPFTTDRGRALGFLRDLLSPR